MCPSLRFKRLKRRYNNVRAENVKLRQEISWLKDECARLWDGFRNVRVSSRLTGLRYGATCKNVASGFERTPRCNTGDGTSVAWGRDSALPLPSTEVGGLRREGWGWRWWPTWCPCCRRPIEITAFKGDDDWESDRTDLPGEGGPRDATVPAQYAYVAVLWGFNTGFVLGALTLGEALRRTGTRHALVLLHTDDIPQSSLRLLEQIWILREVSFVLADQRLYTTLGSLFVEPLVDDALLASCRLPKLSVKRNLRMSNFGKTKTLVPAWVGLGQGPEPGGRGTRAFSAPS